MNDNELIRRAIETFTKEPRNPIPTPLSCFVEQERIGAHYRTVVVLRSIYEGDLARYKLCPDKRRPEGALRRLQ